MNISELKNLLIFAKEYDLMKKPFTEVYHQWLQWWHEYFQDLEADYWIDYYNEIRFLQ